MSNLSLSDINENYNKAQRSRREDYFIVRKNNRKVMSIHLGGIYIECLLKSIIIRKYGIIKRSSCKVSNGKYKQTCWYDENKCNKINSIPSISENDYWNNTTVNNPEHNIVAAFYKIKELSKNAPSTVVTALNYINRPLDIKYIDFRYMSDDDINEKEFIEWENNFKTFIDYFNQKKNLL